MASSIPTRTPAAQAPERGRDAPRGRGREDAAPAGGFRPRDPGTDRRRMLDVRREGHFKYDLREILTRSLVPTEQHPTFIATVLSKGARQSTGDAKDWVTLKMNEGVIAKPERDAINTLIERYSKWR